MKILLAVDGSDYTNRMLSYLLSHKAAFAQAGKFGLLVMGSHGHGTLANLVLGSVATKVLASCTVPVLLVR